MERDRVLIVAIVLVVAGASSVFSRKATRDKFQYAQEEAFAILFPEERSRQGYREESARTDRNLVDNIRAGKFNPLRGWRILKGMDQKTLVELTGISQPNLSCMEKTGAYNAFFRACT